MSLQKQTTKSIVRKRKDSEKLSPKRLLQLSAAGEVFLEGTCPLSRCPQTAKFPAPLLLGARRRWVRKATAFRGRSEQDRSALCFVCCIMILETFRWNVSNASFLLKPINAVQICCSHSKQVIHKPQSPPSAQTRGFFYSRTAAGASGSASPFGTQQEITHCPWRRYCPNCQSGWLERMPAGVS